MENFNELETIKEDLNRCLSLDNGFDKFKRLGEIAHNTDSSALPEFLKERMKDRIQEFQTQIVGILDFGAGLSEIEVIKQDESNTDN